MPDELLNTFQVADELGVKLETLATWRRITRNTGHQVGPEFIHPPGTAMVRYRRTAVTAWLASRPVKSPERDAVSLKQQSTTLGRVRDETGNYDLTQADVDAATAEVRLG